METVRFTKLDPAAIVPKYATADAAGADLYARLPEALTIGAGAVILTPAR